MLPWSVSATARMPSAFVRAARSLIFSAPSSSEYCEWTWRWTNSAVTATRTRCLHTVTNARRKAERAAPERRPNGAPETGPCPAWKRPRGPGRSIRSRSSSGRRVWQDCVPARATLAESYIAAVRMHRAQRAPAHPSYLGPPCLGREKVRSALWFVPTWRSPASR